MDKWQVFSEMRGFGGIKGVAFTFYVGGGGVC